MNGRICAILALVLLVGVALNAGATVKMEQVSVVRLVADTEVAAPSEKVWAYMTTGKNLVTWCPYWKSAKNAEVKITKVGDVLDFKDTWDNGGQSIVTYLDRNKEIRLAHEPTNGSYICQAKLILIPAGAKTKIQYTEQYTDESSIDDLTSNAFKMQKEMEKTLAELKKGVEKE